MSAIEAYKIGCTLAMGEGIGRELTGIIGQFQEIDRLIRNIRKNLTDLPAALKTGVGGMDDIFTKSAAASERVARAMPDVAKQAAATAEAMERAASASRALVPYQGGGAVVPYVSPSTGFSLQGNPYTPYGFSPAGRPYSLPASGGAMVPYQPPTGFTMGDGTGPTYTGPIPNRGSMVPSRPFGTGAMPPLVLPPNPTGHDFALAAMGYGMVGHALTGFTGDVFDAGKETGHQMYMLRAAGWGDDDAKRAFGLAQQMQRDIPGVTVTGALEAQRDLAILFRDPKTGAPNTGAIEKDLPDFLRMATVLAAYGKGGELKGLFETLQQGEMRGLINNDADLHSLLFANEWAAMRSGGRVGPEQILQYLRSSGAAGMGLPASELFGFALPLILSQGSARAGAGLRGFYQQFNAGRISDAGVEMLREMGLIQNPETGSAFAAPTRVQTKSGVWHTVVDPELNKYKKGIGTYQLPPDVLSGWKMLHEGKDFEYIEKVLLPKIKDYNVKHFGFDDVNLESQTGVALSSRIPGGNMLADMFRLWPMIRAYQTSYNESQKSGSVAKDYDLRVSGDPALKVQALQAAWNGFLVSLANGPVMDAATHVLQDMTGGLNALGKFADEHKSTAAVLVGIAEALGVLATAAAAFSAAAWLAGPMVKVGKWAAGTKAAGGAAAAAGVGGRLLGWPVALGSLAWDAPSWAAGKDEDWWGYKYGWSPFHPFSLSKWNKHDGKYEYDWENGSAAPPPTGSGAINLSGTVNLDGRAVGSFVAGHQADQLELPSSGPTNSDLRLTLPQTGLGVW